MANPLPAAAQPIANPRTGIITIPWLQWLAALVADQGNAISWSGVSSGVGYQNSWADLDAARAVQYGTDGRGQVYLRGAMKSGVVNSTAFTLPAAFAPVAARQFAVNSNGAFGVIVVGTDGTVTLSLGSNVSAFLDGILYSIN